MKITTISPYISILLVYSKSNMAYCITLFSDAN